MIQSRRPVSFIATSEPEQAKVFYRDVLDLKLVESSPYALVFADRDNMLRIQIVADLTAAPHTVHGWQVTDITQDIRDLAAKGIVFLTFDQLDQNPLGIWTTPDGHQIAWFKDPSNNILSLTQFQSA